METPRGATDLPAASKSPNSLRWTTIFLCGLLGAVLVLAGIILLTPLEPLAPDASAISNTDRSLVDNGIRADDVPDGSALGGEAVASGHGINIDQMIAQATEELQLPQQPLTITTERLQQELEQLASNLPQQFSQVPAAYHFAAQIWEGLHQTERAETAWNTAISMGTEAPGPYAGLATVLVQTGRVRDAVTLLERAHDQGIQSSETILALAEAFEHLGQLDRARRVMDQADANLARDERWWDTYARILNQAGDYPAAEQAARQAIAIGGQTESRLFLLATTLARQGEREAAKELNQQLQALRQSSINVEAEARFQTSYHTALTSIARHGWLSAALLAAEQEQPQLAEEYFRAALALVPDDAQILMELSTFYVHHQQLPKAIVVQLRLQEVQPENVFNFTNLASLWLQAGRPDRAEAVLLQATELDPDGVLAQSALARLHLARGNLTEARRWATQVLARNHSVESHVLLAHIEQAAGNPTIAEQLLEKARHLNPQHPLLRPTTP